MLVSVDQHCLFLRNRTKRNGTNGRKKDENGMIRSNVSYSSVRNGTQFILAPTVYEGRTHLCTCTQGKYSPIYKGGIHPLGRYSPIYTYEGRTHLRTYAQEGTPLCQGRYSPSNILCTRG